MKLDYDFKQYDLRLLFLMIILNTVGIFIVRSAISAESFKDPLVVRQILGSFVGLSMCIGISLFDYRKLCKFSPYIYAASSLLLAGVRIFGAASVHGPMRWITVPVLGKIQPAEFVKVALILFFAEYLQKTKEDINTAHGLLLEGVYLLLPVGLVLIQPNLSTAIIMTVIVFAMTYASPLKLRFVMVFLGMAAVVLLLLFYLFSSGLYDKIPILQGYQVQRILTFLKPDENSSGYAQQMYSIMAIGSGMFKGKGLFNHSIFSVKNGNFLVEEDNDFIFAVIGEELGFRGSIIIIILFLLIIIECLIIAYRAKTLSGRLICVGVMAWIGFQTYTNIAVATGLFPNTGITLPFFSRGVSSLLSVYFGLGIVLNVALQRKT